MGKVKKGARKKPTVNNSGLPYKIGRFLKKRKPDSWSVKCDPKHAPFLRHVFSIGFPPDLQRPAGYLPPACEEAIESVVYEERITQLLEYAKDPARYMKALAHGRLSGELDR